MKNSSEERSSRCKDGLESSSKLKKSLLEFQKMRKGKNKDTLPNPPIFRENKISADHLLNGETIVIYGFGNSMTPILRDGQPVLVEPINYQTKLKKNDIVFCRIGGYYYLHKIIAIKNNMSFQIGNNQGFINGWISRNQIFGRVIKKL